MEIVIQLHRCFPSSANTYLTPKSHTKVSEDEDCLYNQDKFPFRTFPGKELRRTLFRLLVAGDKECV